MKELKQDEIRNNVRNNYAKVALNTEESSSCCSSTGCCTSEGQRNLSVNVVSKQMGLLP